MSGGLPELESKYSDFFKRVNVGGVFGGIVPGGLEASFYTEEKRIENTLKTEPLLFKPYVLPTYNRSRIDYRPYANEVNP